MTSPHPPSAPASGPAEQIEPAWNPGGRSLSYINRAGSRKLGVIGVLLRTLHFFTNDLTDANATSCNANHGVLSRNLAGLSTEVEGGTHQTIY